MSLWKCPGTFIYSYIGSINSANARKVWIDSIFLHKCIACSFSCVRANFAGCPVVCKGCKCKVIIT